MDEEYVSCGKFSKNQKYELKGAFMEYRAAISLSDRCNSLMDADAPPISGTKPIQPANIS